MSIRRMMLFTLGAKIKNLIQAFKERVLSSQGEFEAESCLDGQLTDLDNKGLLDSASLIVTPNGYKETLLYAVKPSEVGTNLLLRSEEFENGYWYKIRCTISTNQEIAPNGSLTADYVVEDSTTGLRYVGVGVPTTIGQTWTFSIFVKKKDRSNIVIQINEGSAIFPTVKFNFDSQSFTQTTPLMTSSFQSVGDGWFRLIFTRTPTIGTTTIFGIYPTDASGNYSGVGDGVSRTIIWGAQLVTGSTVTNYISTTDRQIINGTIGDMSVTRATTATRVNADGFIEEVPYNLFSQTQNFENAFWTKQLTTIGQDVITAPDGTMTADNVIANSGVTYVYTGANGVNVVSMSFPLNTEQRTLSLYLKYNGLNRIRVMYGSSTNLNGYVFVEVDLQSGIITNSNGGIVASNFFIEDAGNGWYRVGFNLITTLSPTNNRFAVALGDTTKTIANGVDGVYVWGAQMVNGTQPKDYFPTTTRLNIPRIDYSNGSCPSILVEPQRTNLVIQSEQINLWTAGLNTTVTPNVSIGPNGTQTANNINITNINGYWRRLGLNLASSTTYTASVFVKKSATTNNKTFSFYYNNNSISPNNGIYKAVVNLTNLTITTTPAGTITTGRPTIISSLLSDYGSGWYRVIVIFTTGSSAGNSNCEIGFQANDEVVDFDAWGAQLELGPNVTSYIPTTTATVTRNADVISNTNASTLIGQTEGSIFIDFYYKTSNIDNLIFIYNNVLNYLCRARIGSTGVNNFDIAYLSTDMGGAGAFTNPVTLVPNTRNKIAVTYDSVTQRTRLFCNGVFISEKVVLTAFPINQNKIDIGITYFPTVKEINKVSLWKTKLTDAQAIQLTTL